MELYYNINQDQQIRANLVYTPYVQGNVFRMSFNRDPEYHFDQEENKLFTEDVLQDRFERELRFHEKVKRVIPTLEILDVNESKRFIDIEWPSNDFYMLGLKQPYDSILPDWKEQWLHIVRTLKFVHISKFSLHPNSFVIRENRLVPFNWFFCFDRDEITSIESVMCQISEHRADQLEPLLSKYNIKISDKRPAKDFERIGLESFRTHYPKELIDTAIKF